MLFGTVAACAGVALILTVGCTPGMDALRHPPVEVAASTSGIWSSMIYLTRVEGGIVAVDLGWVGSEGVLREALASMGATPADVRSVFLTHSHRDHIAGWRRVSHATFYLSAPESALFVGATEHRGPLTRLVEHLRRTRLPAPGQLRIKTFSSDTQFVFGRDTVRAFPVAGHTAGSAAYLVRGHLFVGDAVTMLPFVGFGRARWIYSDDVRQSTASVGALWKILAVDTTRVMCTAHGKCAPDSDALRAAALH